MSEQTIAILRLRQVRDLTGLSRSSIYSYIAAGTFPRPFRLGPRAVGFSHAAVEAWIAARAAGKSEKEIQLLVARLDQARGGTRP